VLRSSLVGSACAIAYLGEILGGHSCFSDVSVLYFLVAAGEGFEYSAQIHSPARSSTDIIETLSRIAIQAAKSLKSDQISAPSSAA